MKTVQVSLLFLKSVVVLLAILALVFCFFAVPGMAQRDAAAHPETAYLHDPFLAAAYLLFAVFLTALYQTFKLLSYIGQNRPFSRKSVSALKKIQYCALAISFFFAAGLAFLILVIGGDIAGIFTMCLICITASAAVYAFAAVLEKLAVVAHRMQAENERTV